jgi:hypothetical protein
MPSIAAAKTANRFPARTAPFSALRRTACKPAAKKWTQIVIFKLENPRLTCNN